MTTIPELFEAAVERSASRSWLTYEDSTYTYGRAHERIAATAAALVELGVKRGTPVLATTRNSPEYLLAWLALMRLGAILLPVNPESSAAELAGFAGQLHPDVVVTDRALRGVVADGVADAAPGARIVPVEEVAAAPPAEPPAIAARPDDVAVIDRKSVV